MNVFDRHRHDANTKNKQQNDMESLFFYVTVLLVVL